jgi:hypothetical protein
MTDETNCMLLAAVPGQVGDGGKVTVNNAMTASGAQVAGKQETFIGAALAVALGDRSASGLMALGSVLMLAGVVLHLAESHGHAHAHAALEHEHAHRHDDGHHGHTHDPMPAGEHNHPHLHGPLQHAHAHVPDAHHPHLH